MQVSIFFNNKIPLAGIFPLEIFRSFIRNIEIFLMALFTRSIPPTSWDFRKLHQEHWYFPPLILHKIHLPPTFFIFSEDSLGTFRSSSNYLESLTLNFLGIIFTRSISIRISITGIVHLKIFMNIEIFLLALFPQEIFISFIRNIDIFLLSLFTRSISLQPSWDFQKHHEDL